VREARNIAQTPLFRRHVRRPRLTALLDEATAQSIILTAPAGYGKTTLAREWLQGRERAAWYRATAASADVGAFSAGLADAVAPVVPGAGERVRQRLRVGDATERLARPLAELLAEDLETWPAGAIIVLDDYHLLAESAPVETFLDWLLTLAPIRVLVTTRRRPGWASARRFLYDEAVEIGRGELAMTNDEAAAVLAGRSTAAVHALVRQAAGWPAVIGLAALSADLAFPPEKASRSLYRYFADEVLRAEPPEIQRIMLSAAVPSAITPRIAEEVLELGPCEPLLLRLRAEALLHEIPTGELVFHPLIHDFLRRRLEADDPERLADLRRKVVDDARANARWEEAFDLSLQAGRAAEAAEIVGTAARQLLALGQGETVEKWLTACGAAGVTVPGAALARAELLIRKGEMSAAAAVGRDTVDRLPEDHHDYAWACNATGRALHFTSREEEALALLERAHLAARRDEDVMESLWGLVLVAVEVEPARAPTLLDDLQSRFPDDLDVRLRLAVGRSVAAEQGPSLQGVWERFEALLPAVQHSRDPLAASCFLAIGAAMAVMQGSYDRGRQLADQALALCGDLRLAFGMGTCLAHRAAAELGLRQFVRARRSIRQVVKTPIYREDPFFQLEVLRLKTRLLASQGAYDEALLTESDLPLGHLPARPYGALLSNIALIRASLGDARGARETASRAREHGSNIEMRYCTLLSDAIAEQIDGNEKRSASLAIQAVTQCGEANYLDGLVFACRVHPPLMKAAGQDPRALGVIRRALTAGGDYRLARAEGLPLHPDPGGEDALGILTQREREVLGLLLEGKTNREIASSLFITSSTVKVHMRHILEKLGVRTRLHAVLRAQELVERNLP
jgi:ATP/maltotriose-dependent transcriptional regulator MalT